MFQKSNSTNKRLEYIFYKYPALKKIEPEISINSFYSIVDIRLDLFNGIFINFVLKDENLIKRTITVENNNPFETFKLLTDVFKEDNELINVLSVLNVFDADTINLKTEFSYNDNKNKTINIKLNNQKYKLILTNNNMSNIFIECKIKKIRILEKYNLKNVKNIQDFFNNIDLDINKDLSAFIKIEELKTFDNAISYLKKEIVEIKKINEILKY